MPLHDRPRELSLHWPRIWIVNQAPFYGATKPTGRERFRVALTTRTIEKRLTVNGLAAVEPSLDPVLLCFDVDDVFSESKRNFELTQMMRVLRQSRGPRTPELADAAQQGPIS